MAREHNFSDVFYPKDYGKLIASIQSFFSLLNSSSEDIKFLQMVNEYIQNKKILSFIVPHGSYDYSGYVSAFTYYLIDKIQCQNFIILSSDHRGTSPGISVLEHGTWNTPLGPAQINETMANNLIRKSSAGFLEIDSFSFDIDYTIETQLPFIQVLKKNNFRFLPILQRKQDKKTCIQLAKLLASIIPQDEKVVLISTTNFTHYLGYEECYAIDKKLIAEISKMDVESFYNTLKYYFQYICGYGCVATTIEFSKLFGNFDVILLKHLTSGDIDGKKSSVVGYSSILML
ncbi:MAG: AmmeMemoRadiSam system protein B [Candidatus Nitrosocosmicus sp.]|nr:AmmeMemoRadiSam system protein B [Candidatus Nitrosocosmicus sp.]MDN5866495.1 AmmeMemoRadiSam system protein B [Candidatus Nitrosocosmicus sp.]